MLARGEEFDCATSLVRSGAFLNERICSSSGRSRQVPTMKIRSLPTSPDWRRSFSGSHGSTRHYATGEGAPVAAAVRSQPGTYRDHRMVARPPAPAWACLRTRPPIACGPGSATETQGRYVRQSKPRYRTSTGDQDQGLPLVRDRVPAPRERFSSGSALPDGPCLQEEGHSPDGAPSDPDLDLAHGSGNRTGGRDWTRTDHQSRAGYRHRPAGEDGDPTARESSRTCLVWATVSWWGRGRR